MASIPKVYSRIAKSYDLEEKLLLLTGMRLGYYRKVAVGELKLKPGDTVIDLACGTGLNFSMLEKAVGPKGKIIGVDLTDAMLDEARKKIARNGWKNVELVHSDVEKYEFPEADGILTTCAITLVPGYDDVIRRGSESLKEGGRFVVMDFKKPKWPMWLIKIALRLFIEPFGGTLEMGQRHPWESLKRYLKMKTFREFYFGSTYVAAAER